MTTTRAKKGIGPGLKIGPVVLQPVSKPSLEALEAFGAGQSPTAPPPGNAVRKDKVEKAQITLHIPLDEEQQLRNEYMAQPAGHRGRFSDFVYQFLKAGREAMVKKG